MKHSEYELQVKVCEYINTKHPSVLFLSDTIASIKLNVMQGARNKKIQKSGFKTPDLIILQPNKNFKGLFIELKTKSPYKKNGEILQNEHLIGQQNSIYRLNLLGYYACFAWSYDQCVEIIDTYMSDIQIL
jgi:hypothetical protein